MGQLLQFLEPIADRMEDTEAEPAPLKLLGPWGTRTMILDKVVVPRESPPPLPVAARLRVSTTGGTALLPEDLANIL